jgi:hypothetical protein
MFDLIGGNPDFRDLLDPPYMKTLPPFPRGKRRGGAVAFWFHTFSLPLSVPGSTINRHRK